MRHAMSHENRNPSNRRRLAALSMALVVVVSVAVFAAATAGPGRAIDWVSDYLIPVAVITGAIVATLALLVWVVQRSPDPPYRDRLQWVALK